ncbi:MAG: HD domain-containing protein [Clostridiales bacterium]|jgi:3'-5' exoribonuclease|nr:HD domain-containing protein [Clostridiales bacterium]
MRYIDGLKENEHIIEHYLCKQKQSLKTRSGKTYLSLKLQDKTGVADAKVWELTNDIHSFEEGEVIKIDGTVLLYQNDLQIKIARIRRSLDGEYAIDDYIPCTEKDIEEMYGQITGYIQSLKNPMIRGLVENILINDGETVRAFKSHSAAKALHHSFMGGLLEHTLSVTQICDFMSARYKYINRDLLLSTAMLHDIGKIYELSKMPDNDYTDDGQMLGHIMMGAEMVTAEAAKIPGFPHELLSLMKHSIVSHHGEYEFGSPKLPSTMEAFILHCADNMDAKVKAYEETLDQDKTPGRWTAYQKMFNRYLRKSDYTQS